MQEKPKENIEPNKEDSDGGEKPTWAEDQKQRGYYYDDSHGYEVYDADKEGDEDDNQKTSRMEPDTTGSR
jgi:hypothetical protein